MSRGRLHAFAKTMRSSGTPSRRTMSSCAIRKHETLSTLHKQSKLQAEIVMPWLRGTGPNTHVAPRQFWQQRLFPRWVGHEPHNSWSHGSVDCLIHLCI
jgi:hypothetical protein